MIPPRDRVQDGRHLLEQESPLYPMVGLEVNATPFRWQMRALQDRLLAPFPCGPLIPPGARLPERSEGRA
jgi:hypothetical protein